MARALNEHVNIQEWENFIHPGISHTDANIYICKLLSVNYQSNDLLFVCIIEINHLLTHSKIGQNTKHLDQVYAHVW